MKKGMYYLPLLLILVANSVASVFIENTFALVGWIMATLLLCEVYYLRFLK